MSESAERLPETIRAIQNLLERDAVQDLLEYVADLHPSDLADVVEHIENEDDRLRLLEILPAPLASDALAEMEEEEHPAELLAQMQPERIAELVEELADDDAADLIGDLEPEERERVLESVAEVEAEEIRELLEYPEESAGGIMTLDLVAVSSEASAGEAIEQLRERAAEREDFYTIFVVDPDEQMRGVVTLRRLVLASPSTPIRDLVEEPPAVVPVDMDQEEVGRTLSRYNIPSIGVVDPDGRLVGRVTFDDIIDVVESETTEDILRFASVSDEERIRGSTVDAVRSRLPWLAVNFVTLSAAALVVWLYRETIEQAVILAVAMPVIAGLGGNAGTQALAVTIRRIATTDETLAERWPVVGKELLVGVINGLVIALIVAVVGILLGDGDPTLGLVFLIAMWGNLIIASTGGAFFPILLESLGIDPAVASSIFVTTFTDLFGFLLLLALAQGFLL
jgi:magnesium transporter